MHALTLGQFVRNASTFGRVNRHDGPWPEGGALHRSRVDFGRVNRQQRSPSREALSRRGPFTGAGSTFGQVNRQVWNGKLCQVAPLIAGQWGEGSLRGEGLIGFRPLFPQGKQACYGSLPLAWNQAQQKKKAWRHCVQLSIF